MNEQATIPTADQQAATAARHRRIARVLGDLGLADAVGIGWATGTASGTEFGSLSTAQTLNLLRRLEDLLERATPVATGSVVGQATLDFDAIEGPAPVVIERSGLPRGEVTGWVRRRLPSLGC